MKKVEGMLERQTAVRRIVIQYINITHDRMHYHIIGA